MKSPKDVEVTSPSNAANNNEYIVVVEVTSGTGARALTATQTVTVTVTDVDTEAPDVPAAPTVAEATFNSLKVQWTAPTNTGPEITAYDVRHILSSASAADKMDDTKWMVDEDVWTSGNLEYTIGSLDQDTSYDVQVRAENDEGISGWSDTLAGTTTANVAPIITSASAVSVSENSTADIVTVTAEDSDSDDNIEDYSIVAEADGSQFEINDQSGVLTFKAPPNYESPTDVAVTNPSNAANNNEYIVVVEVTSGTGDRALTARQTLTVTVTDVDTEAPNVPDAPTVAEATFNSLKVQWTAPDNTGPEISSYDVRHILTSATDKADDTKWTEVADAWTSGDGGSLEYTIGSLRPEHKLMMCRSVQRMMKGISGWSDTSCGGDTEQNVAPVILRVHQRSA